MRNGISKQNQNKAFILNYLVQVNINKQLGIKFKEKSIMNQYQKEGFGNLLLVYRIVFHMSSRK
jgi:hypothetical protein